MKTQLKIIENIPNIIVEYAKRILFIGITVIIMKSNCHTYSVDFTT